MGFAFDPDGRLFVGNRVRGEVFGPITRGDEPYLYVEDRVMGKGKTIAVMKFEVIGNTGDTSTLTGTVTTASKTDGTEISVSDRG